ncbi:hypothetical protein HMPREF3226_00661 [Prevotella corporis]|uniref:Uncharacterized protein n=1 Tax=Prevotella corporis TaxID=28128 RepID=A0A133QHM4_9BACT|nr:hypothetical protein HMPREF3226_00661 [Prevotella corporis]
MWIGFHPADLTQGKAFDKFLIIRRIDITFQKVSFYQTKGHRSSCERSPFDLRLLPFCLKVGLSSKSEGNLQRQNKILTNCS